MAPDQSPSSTHVGGRAPANVKAAVVDWTHHLNGQDPYTDVKQSHLVRQALYEWMLEHWDEAPEDVKEKIDREWLEDKVEGGLGVEP